MSDARKPAKVFISYASKDEPLCIKLEKHLSPLWRNGFVTTWYQWPITAGIDWTKTLDYHLNTASVILFLVSPDFIASEACYGKGMQRALERNGAGEACVIPILLRPVDWQSTPLGGLQALPKNGRPITKWRNRDEALADVVKDVRARFLQSSTGTVLGDASLDAASDVAEKRSITRENEPQESMQRVSLPEQKEAKVLFGMTRRKLLLGGITITALAAAALASFELFITSVQITIDYGSDKKEWLQQAEGRFESQKKQIQILLDQGGGKDVVDAIVLQRIRPTVRLSDSLELGQLESQWEKKYPNTRIIASASDNFAPQTLLQTPLVFGIWKSRADVLLEYCGGKIELETIHRALLEQGGWAALGGDPAWRGVKLGQVSPCTSHLGSLWLILIAYSFFKKEQGLTLQDVQDSDFRKYFLEIEGKVNKFGGASRTYIESVVGAEGPSGFDIVFSEESVLLSNWHKLENQWHEPLIIYYPKSTFPIDNTYAILQAPWVKPEEQNAAYAFQQFLLQEEQQRLGLQYGFRPGNISVSIESNVPHNLFLAEYSSGFHVQQNLPPAVQVPSVDVANALRQLWIDHFGGLPLAGG